MGERRTGTGVRADAGGASVTVGVLAGWVVLDPAGETATQVVSAAAQTVAPVLAGIACWRVAGRATSAGRRAWRLVGTGALAWAAGQVAYLVADGIGPGEPPFPSVADAGFMALLPLAAAGLLVHPAAPRGRAALARLLADGLIAGGAMRFILWTLVLASRHEGRGTDAFEHALGFAYAVGDFVVVTIAVLVALRATGRRRGALLGVAAAFALVGAGDGLYSFATLGDGYETGSAIDLLWVAGFLGLAVSARIDGRLDGEAGLPAPGVDDTLPRTLLPYSVVVPALVVGIADAGPSGDIDASQFWNALAVAVLVLARHIVDRVQNVRLVRSLRDTVDELRERDEQLQEAQRLAHLGSWKWDLVSDTLTWTDEVYRIFGLSRDEFTPSLMGYLEQIHPGDRARVTGFVEYAVETGEAFLFEHRIAGAEGRLVQCRGRAVMDERGAFVQLVGTVQDVTTVRRLAEELERRLAELERSNADLTHFASVASHDLASPVQLMLGHLRLLRERTRDDLDLTNVELIEGAIRGAQRLEELIQDILDYSLATGDDDLRAAVDVGRIVREAARMVGAEHWAARIEVGALPTIEAHPGQMRQLFQNLLSNGLKFVPSDTTPVIRVSAERVEGSWCFSVADNGIGVPEVDRERIFHMFERADGVDVRGTGIGLAICARIVARHGGHIWVERAAGRGSVFRFTLAQRTAEPAPAFAASPAG